MAQQSARIQTSTTTLEFRAGDTEPTLLTVTPTAGEPWKSVKSEPLIGSVERSGKTVPVRWHLDKVASETSATRIRFVYRSADPKLVLTWEWRARSADGPIEHTTSIENQTGEEIWIPLQSSLGADFVLPKDAALRQLYVEKGADTPSADGTHHVEVVPGYLWRGYSSTYGHPIPGQPREIIPWSLVQRADSAQSGWYLGIEFSGRTRIDLKRGNDRLRVLAGLNPEPSPFRTRLLPGETFETPTVFLGTFTGGFDEAGNGLRRWVRNVLGNPETWKNPDYPVLVNNSWGSGMQVDETLALRMVRDSAELGLEMFHLDAGWFRGVGDWYPNPTKFPHGLKVISDAAHKAGLTFGIWVDWAQAGASTEKGALNVHDPIVNGWLVTDLPPDWKPEQFKGETIDIGVPAAHDWAKSEVHRIVRDYGLDMLEHDGYLVAEGCVQKDHPHAPPSDEIWIQKDAGFRFAFSANSTDVSYHATRAYYEIHNSLRQAKPNILLEVCNDGGRMVDFGSAAHADYFSITDTYDPLSNRRAFYDTSHVLPPAMLESYVEKWPVPKIENFRYMLRSGMMGWLTIMLDTTAWSDEQHRVAKDEIAFYKSTLRPLIRDANLYHISERPDGVNWDGLEYFDPKTKTGVVYAFRGSSEKELQHKFVLKGLEPSKRYAVHFRDHSSRDLVRSGNELMTRGLTIALSLPNSSEVVVLAESVQTH